MTINPQQEQTMAQPIQYPHPGHLNGSGVRERVEAHREALEALRAAEDALRKIAPHGRDWQGAGDPRVFVADQQEFVSRLIEIEQIRSAVEDEAMQWAAAL
jgi:hypothetical protein